MIAVVLLVVLIALILLRVPVAFAILASGLVGLLMLFSLEGVQGVMEIVPLDSVQRLSLSAIPLFILMAHLLMLSGMMDALFTSARGWFGRMPGGSGVASAAAGIGFSAVTGSSTAAAATLSQTTVPQLIKEGYRPTTATGLVAAVGTLAGMIPPSVILVFYAITAETNVGDILIAGLVPGLIIGLALVVTMLLPMLWDSSRVPRGEATAWPTKVRGLVDALPIAVIFILVVALLYFGITTATESAAVGCLAALVLAGFRRKVTLKAFIHALMETVKTSTMIFAIIIAAHVFSYAFAGTKAAESMVDWVGNLPVPPIVVMFALMAIYLVLGFFMDQIAIIALTVPIVLPLVETLGYDALWFGIFIVLMGEIGLITPPLGINVFVVARSTGRDTVEVFRGALPYVVAMTAVGAAFVVWPELVMWLPNTM